MADIAFGFDRLVMLITGRTNLRETIAFPKTASATDLLTDAPSEVDDTAGTTSIRLALKQPAAKAHKKIEEEVILYASSIFTNRTCDRS